jgi:hypothetical protein
MMPVMNVMTGVRAQLNVNRQASVDYVLRYFSGLAKLSINGRILRKQTRISLFSFKGTVMKGPKNPFHA